jgi:hypothetical protein
VPTILIRKPSSKQVVERYDQQADVKEEIAPGMKAYRVLTEGKGRGKIQVNQTEI